jgi:hypothetical protein
MVEQFLHGQGFQLAEAQKTLPLEAQLMTIQVKKKILFDVNIFTMDFSLSGVKRESSEMTPESLKGSRQIKSTEGKLIMG